MSTRFAFVLLCAALAILPACNTADQPNITPATASTAGIDKAGMDTSVAAGDDFYAYANGAWLKATEIPPDKSSYGPANILVDETRKQIAALIQESSNSAGSTSVDA